MSFEHRNRTHLIWFLGSQIGLESRQTVVRGTMFVPEQKK